MLDNSIWRSILGTYIVVNNQCDVYGYSNCFNHNRFMLQRAEQEKIHLAMMAAVSCHLIEILLVKLSIFMWEQTGKEEESSGTRGCGTTAYVERKGFPLIGRTLIVYYHEDKQTRQKVYSNGRERQPCWINRSEFAARTLNHWPFTRTGEQPSAKRGA